MTNTEPTNPAVDPAVDTVVDPEATPAATPQWVRVVVLGGDTQRLDFTAGMTVRQAMNASDVRQANGQVITVNGVPADQDTILDANSVLQVTNRVKNG